MRRITTLAAAAIAFSAWSGSPAFSGDVVSEKQAPAIPVHVVSIPNAHVPAPGLLTGGQPTPEQLEAAARAGYRTLINLRSEGEPGNDWVPEAASRLGMRYVWIPVTGASGLTRDNAQKLDSALRETAGKEKVIVYCGSGNRVGALLALRAAWFDGAAPEKALKLGLDAGMTRLEPDVRKLLGIDAPN